MPDFPFDDEVEDDDGPGVSIIEDRRPYAKARSSSTTRLGHHRRNLEAAYVALNQAFRGIWVPKAQEAKLTPTTRRRLSRA